MYSMRKERADLKLKRRRASPSEWERYYGSRPHPAPVERKEKNWTNSSIEAGRKEEGAT